MAILHGLSVLFDIAGFNLIQQLLVYLFLKLVRRGGRTGMSAGKPRLGASKRSRDFEPDQTKLTLLH